MAERAFPRGPSAPLAVRMRPDEPRRGGRPGPPAAATGRRCARLVDGSGAASVILYGPPGTGKTTLASLISQATGRRFEALSALSAGVKDVRAVIDVARRAAVHGQQTVLFIDEVHRFSKTQQDALLAAVENRVVLLVAATTENPSFSVVAPLLSRSLILQLQPLTPDAVRAVVERAIADPRGLGGVGRGRRRRRRAAGATGRRGRPPRADRARGRSEAGERVTVEVIEQSLDKAAVRYDRDGDQHYDVDQRVHQVGARIRRRRRAALPGPHADRGGGPALHRAAAGRSWPARTSGWPIRRRC